MFSSHIKNSSRAWETILRSAPLQIGVVLPLGEHCLVHEGVLVGEAIVGRVNKAWIDGFGRSKSPNLFSAGCFGVFRRASFKD